MRVGGRAGALVRASCEMDSAAVGTVARGTVVTVAGEDVASDGTARVCLSAPLAGWVSASRLVEAGAAPAPAVEPGVAEYDEAFRTDAAPRESFCASRGVPGVSRDRSDASAA